jgi:tetrapyrrole methylase family protein/MazG family protein
MPQEKTYTFEDLRKIIADLRDPQRGCPWDKEQTHQSLKPYMMEEAAEAIDAVDEGPTALKEELGDVLLQIFLHSQIAHEAKTFSIDDVIDGLAKKLIERHPHVFGDIEVSSSAEVVKNWNTIKEKDKKRESLLDGIAKSLPALSQAQKIGDRVGRIGFDWLDARGVIEKVDEELSELQAEIETPNSAEAAEEFGDLLFTVAQLSRFLGLEAEQALRKSNEKFSRRFRAMESIAGGSVKDKKPEELHALWEQAKQLIAQEVAAK